MHASNVIRSFSAAPGKPLVSRLRLVTACVVAVAACAGCKGGDDSPPEEKSVSQAATPVAPASSAPVAERHIKPPTMPPALPAPPDVAAPPKDAVKLPSGVYTKVLQPGTGTEHPQPSDIEYMNYACWRKDGVMFDRSNGKRPYSMNMAQVIPGWREGLRLMVAGEKRRIWIPKALAWGDNARPSAYADAYGDVVVDVELVKIDTSNRTSTSQPPPAIAARPNG
jgi:peptidylprolyl isomerase